MHELTKTFYEADCIIGELVYVLYPSIHPSFYFRHKDRKTIQIHIKHTSMNKGKNTHAPYMTFTALNHWTILLLDITHWLANSRPTRELCTTASADRSDRSIKNT